MRVNSFDSYKDDELCLFLKKGDRRVLSHIFHKYYSDLLFYGLKIFNDRDLVEDVIQDLFLIVWKNRLNLGMIISIKSYLIISLKRALLRKIKENRTNQIKLKDFFTDHMVFTFSHEDFLIHHEKFSEESEALIECVNSLPNRQKEAIFLKYYEGLTYEELESVMSLNYQSVVNLIHKGIANLKSKGALQLLTKPSK